MQAGCLEFPQLFFAVSSESYSYIFNLPWLSQDRIYCFKNNKDLNISFIRIIIIWGRGMLNFVAWSRDDMSNILGVDRFGSSSLKKWEGAKFIWLIFSKYIGQELGDRRQWHMLTWGYKNKCCFILASIMMNKQIIFAEFNLHLFDLFITGNFWCSFCHVWCTGSGSLIWLRVWLTKW